MATTVTVELPGVKDNTGKLRGFEVWWDDPTSLIPVGEVAEYTIRRCDGREWYTITLEFAPGIIDAWERKKGLVLWDNKIGEEITPENSIFEASYEPVAALYYVLLERGRYSVLSEEEGYLLEAWWAFEE